MSIIIARTIDEVLSKYTDAESIKPAYERVLIFSWNDMLLLQSEIERLRLMLKMDYCQNVGSDLSKSE